jgi:hypothetical protein
MPSWLTMGSIDDTRAILAAMMGAMATVLALIFSVALLVLSMVSTLFGPRLLYRFLQDWVTQVMIGMFMARSFTSVSFSSSRIRIRRPPSSFIPQVSLITAWMLVMLSFGFLVYDSHRVAKSIQNTDMIGCDRRRFVFRSWRRPGLRQLARAQARCPTTPRFCTKPIVAQSYRARTVERSLTSMRFNAADSLDNAPDCRLVRY